jgi:hypothetical protein
MNAKSLSATSLPLSVGGHASFANWQAGANIHSGARNGNHLDLVESLPGKRQPASGLDPENNLERYEANNCNGARGAIAGLAEAFRCALGISKDRRWINYVMERRRAVTKKAQELFNEQSDAGDA